MWYCMWDMGRCGKLYNTFGENKGYLTDLHILFGDPTYDPIFHGIILITKIAIYKK